jgi:hypothetical protein
MHRSDSVTGMFNESHLSASLLAVDETDGSLYDAAFLFSANTPRSQIAARSAAAV